MMVTMSRLFCDLKWVISYINDIRAYTHCQINIFHKIHKYDNTLIYINKVNKKHIALHVQYVFKFANFQ